MAHELTNVACGRFIIINSKWRVGNIILYSQFTILVCSFLP